MFKLKYLFWLFISFVLGGVGFALTMAIFLCYYLFCKGFMVYTYYPTLIESVELAKEYGQLKAESKIKEIKSDSKLKYFLKDNAQFTESRLWWLYQQNYEQFKKTVEGSSGFAFLVFPLILWQYYDLRKVNRHLRKRLESK